MLLKLIDSLYSFVCSFFDNPLDGDLTFTVILAVAATSLVAWMVWDTIKVYRS